MGYDLHITRRAEWSDPDSGPPITRVAFDRVVLGDARFRRDEVLGPQLAVLVKKPRGGGDAPGLCWQDGEITSKNAPQSFIKVAVEMAAALNARVVGDDGEVYSDDRRATGDEDEEQDRDDLRDDGSDARLAESDADMRSRLRRERAERILQCSGIAAFLAIFVVLMGRQLGWW